jgi:4'-phosphopantetheinyl transferase
VRIGVGSGELHLWLTTVPGPRQVEAAACRRWLSAAERESELRRPTESLRHEYRCGRAVTRQVLASYLDAAPPDIEFVVDGGGKPRLAATDAKTPSFSLSHTRGLVAVLVGGGGTIGVDVEPVNRSISDALSRAFLGDAEARSLALLHQSDRQQRLLGYWTLKEAYAKALGTGLVLPMRDTQFQIGDDLSAKLEPSTGPEDRPWWFALPAAAAGYVVAVAASRRERAVPQLLTFSGAVSRDGAVTRPKREPVST